MESFKYILLMFGLFIQKCKALLVKFKLSLTLLSSRKLGFLKNKMSSSRFYFYLFPYISYVKSVTQQIVSLFSKQSRLWLRSRFLLKKPFGIAFVDLSNLTGATTSAFNSKLLETTISYAVFDPKTFSYKISSTTLQNIVSNSNFFFKIKGTPLFLDRRSLPIFTLVLETFLLLFKLELYAFIKLKFLRLQGSVRSLLKLKLSTIKLALGSFVSSPVVLKLGLLLSFYIFILLCFSLNFATIYFILNPNFDTNSATSFTEIEFNWLSDKENALNIDNFSYYYFNNVDPSLESSTKTFVSFLNLLFFEVLFFFTLPFYNYLYYLYYLKVSSVFVFWSLFITVHIGGWRVYDMVLAIAFEEYCQELEVRADSDARIDGSLLHCFEPAEKRNFLLTVNAITDREIIYTSLFRSFPKQYEYYLCSHFFINSKVQVPPIFDSTRAYVLKENPSCVTQNEFYLGPGTRYEDLYRMKHSFFPHHWSPDQDMAESSWPAWHFKSAKHPMVHRKNYSLVIESELDENVWVEKKQDWYPGDVRIDFMKYYRRVSTEADVLTKGILHMTSGKLAEMVNAYTILSNLPEDDSKEGLKKRNELLTKFWNTRNLLKMYHPYVDAVRDANFLLINNPVKFFKKAAFKRTVLFDTMFSLDIAEAQFATRVLTKTAVGGSLPILSIVSKGFAPAVPATWACNYSNNTLWVLDTFTFNKVYHDVDDTSLLIRSYKTSNLPRSGILTQHTSLKKNSFGTYRFRDFL